MTLGHKNDKGKLAFRLIPLDALKETVRVLMFGAFEAPREDGTKGYGEDNWIHVPQARERYYDAALRHLTAWYEGERNDQVSGLHHLAHASCCVLFNLALDLRPVERIKRAAYKPVADDDASAIVSDEIDSIKVGHVGESVPAYPSDDDAEVMEVDAFAFPSIELAPAMTQVGICESMGEALRWIDAGRVLVAEHGTFLASNPDDARVRINVGGSLMIAVSDPVHGWSRTRVYRLVVVQKAGKAGLAASEAPRGPDGPGDASTGQPDEEIPF